MNLKKKIAQNLINSLGWKTTRKIIVFESDDWGSIRMPSKNVYKSLLKEGVRVDLCPYNRYDNLATKDDLEYLFNVLTNFKDKKGSHPVFTANTNVANPDFKKIAQSDFKEYNYEPFTETLKKYSINSNIFSVWNDGIDNKLFYPQLHGREHVNPISWMKLLRDKHFEIRRAFEYNSFGLSRITSPNIKILYLASLIFESDKEQKIIEKSIIESAALFENIFGFTSKSFIAPLYIWDIKLEKTLNEIGVKYIQGANSHSNYNATTNKVYRVKRHFCGDKNSLNQFYLLRNCSFEPSLSKNFDVNSTLKEIEIAFRWKKPAIITSHRVNYIGALDKRNRETGLKLLNELLTKIIKKWPDVEFMNSADLGETIENTKR